MGMSWAMAGGGVAAAVFGEVVFLVADHGEIGCWVEREL